MDARLKGLCRRLNLSPIDRIQRLGPIQGFHNVAGVRVYGTHTGIKTELIAADRIDLEAIVANRSSPTERV